MLSIAQMSGAGQGEYYLNLAQEDYYTKGVEPPGKWYGTGADGWGLKGHVAAEHLRSLLQGYSPDKGSEVVQNAGKINRQSGWDLTFSAPKSVSVAWSQADSVTRSAIEVAHERAVHSALSYLEREAGITRRGKGGYEKEPAQLTFAVFEHGTSRAQDPALHSHALLLNVGLRADSTTGTVESRGVYQHKMAAGALYRAELSFQLERSLGLHSEKKGKAFELSGVPKPLVSEFSKRRKEIESHLEATGFEGAKAAKVATLATRSAKESLTREELFRAWKEVGIAHGWSEGDLNKLLYKAPLRAEERAELGAEWFQNSVQTLTYHQSSFTRKDIVRGVSERAQGEGVGAEFVLATVESHLQSLVSLGVVQGEVRYTTREMLDLEKRMLSQVEAVKKQAISRGVVTEGVLKKALKQRPTILEEQKNAVLHITKDGRGISVVSGMAGTGKSFMLGVAHDAWRFSGYQVHGAALSGKAAQGLFEGSGIPSDTIHKLLSTLERGELTLTKNSIVVIDEAGMVGTRQMERLVHYTQQAGAKLVLVGDAKQLQPVEAGGPFAEIGRSLGEAALTDIRRQREGWAKGAVKSFAAGRAKEGLRAFAERGQLHVAESRKAASIKLMDDWKKKGVSNPKSHLILAGTNEDTRLLNAQAQRRRYYKGVVQGQSLQVGEAHFYQEDRVLFTRNSHLYGVRNGQLATISKVDIQTSELTVKLDSGKSVRFSIDEYDHIRLGYAVTTHKSQGMTADNTYVLLGGGMQDRELSYVQVSRAKDATRLYTDKVEAGEKLREISRQMSKSRQKELAVSLKKKAEGDQNKSLGLRFRLS